jgi:hypothetical protein
MNEVSRTTAPDTAACPSWCEVDHESGATACQTERRAVVRVPKADPRGVSTVHAFRVGEESDIRLTIGTEFFTVTAAREFAAKIRETCDEVTTADPAAVETLRSIIEGLGYQPGPTVRDGMSVAEAARGAISFGSMLGELQAL